MSGDDVRVRAASSAATSSTDVCDPFARMAKLSNHTCDSMTVVLRTRMQTGQI